jgi:uncharacterized protein (DUF1800 family)
MSSMLLVWLFGCGGGGGGGNSPAPVGTPQPLPPVTPPPPPALNVDALNAASRFAATASFGLAYADLVSLAEQGHESWLYAQLAEPASLHQPLVESLIARRDAGEFDAVEEDIELLISFRRYAWWHRAMTAPDQLRQRVTFALSEIFVVSDNVDALIINPLALSNYEDMLLTNAFGNFRDLLRAVTLHPAMGIYLSHVNNRRSDPIANIFPDENYAREVMQLFSIGLYELNPDGSRQLDAIGNPIATYGNHEVREFAKIFTGLSYGGPVSFFGKRLPEFTSPMRMFDAFHEPGSKTLLRGAVIPAGQTGIQDIDAAIDNLFEHPNVGPFISAKLIQRLITSNPSPGYIARVSRVFDGTDSGVRGDMAAVIKAILLDPEASAAADATQNRGKLREPVLRHLALMRQLNATSSDGYYFNAGFLLQQLVGQHPLSSPSVFNFFLPSHTPAGEIAAAGLVAPEFQITTTTTVVGITNLVDFAVNGDFVMDAQPPFGEVTLDLSEFEVLAADPIALMDRLDLLFTSGSLNPDTRAVIVDIIDDIEDLPFRARTAIYLMLISPDYAIEI